MKYTQAFYYSIGTVAAGIMLMALSGCGWLQTTDIPSSVKIAVQEVEQKVGGATTSTVRSGDTSEVLMTMYDTKVPKITVRAWNDYLHEFKNAQPQYAQVIESVPGAKRNIFDGFTKEIIVGEWAQKTGIESDPEFQADLNKILEYGKRSLYIKKFQEAHPVKVTASEVKAFYEEQKNKIPQLMMSPGGVTAKGVSFTQKEAAQKFYDAAKVPGADFDAVAKAQNLTVKDLGVVHQQSFDVDAAVRKTLADATRVPSVHMITLNDGSFMVVKAFAKKEAQYVPFEQVQAGIEAMLKNQKSAEVFGKELDALAKQYNVVINYDFFEREEKVATEQQKKMAEVMNKTAKKEAKKEQAPAPKPLKTA